MKIFFFLVLLVTFSNGSFSSPETSAKAVKSKDTIRYRISKITPVTGPQGKEWLKLRVMQSYGKMDVNAHIFFREMETQELDLLFPKEAGSELKAGDILNYKIASHYRNSSSNPLSGYLITFEIRNQLPGEFLVVSNLEPVDFQLRIEPRLNAANRSFAYLPINPVGELPKDYILMNVVESQKKAELPIRITRKDSYSSENTDYIRFALEILEPPSVRRDKIQAFINETKQRELASGIVTQQLIDELTGKNEAALKAMESYYTENQTGHFVLNVELYLDGQKVEEATRWFKIKKTGNFFDKLTQEQNNPTPVP